MVKIYTKYDRPPKKFDPACDDHTVLVEVAGYIPKELRIRNIIEAGQRLKDWRAAIFDVSNPDQINEKYEAFPYKGMDFAEAKRVMDYLDAKKAERKKALEDSKKANDPHVTLVESPVKTLPQNNQDPAVSGIT